MPCAGISHPLDVSILMSARPDSDVKLRGPLAGSTILETMPRPRGATVGLGRGTESGRSAYSAGIRESNGELAPVRVAGITRTLAREHTTTQPVGARTYAATAPESAGRFPNNFRNSSRAILGI